LERRKHRRYRFSELIDITWTDADAKERSATGIGIDVSVFGMAVELPVPLPADTKTRVCIERKPIRGGATVRYSHPVASSFRVGLAFETSLLSAHLPSVEAVLPRDMASGCLAPGHPQRGRLSNTFVSCFRKSVCFLMGHELGWARKASSNDMLMCRRCEEALAVYRER
jgi:PilZ domain